MNITKREIIYSVVSLFLLALVIISLDAEQSVLANTLHLVLGLILTQSYVIWGLLGPKLQEKVWQGNKTWKDHDNEQHDGFLNPIFVLIISLLMAVLVSTTVWSLTPGFKFVDSLIITLYIVFPAVILNWRHWSTMFVSAIWVWFPIEFGPISDYLGNLRFQILPNDALIGLFTLLWPAIMLGRHLPWYDWNITKEHLKYFNLSSIAVTIAVVPLGILMYFLKPNLDNIRNQTEFDSPAVLVIMIFVAIFVVQGLMEETLFRGIIFKHWFYHLESKKNADNYRNLCNLSIISMGLLVASTPWWDEVLGLIATILPFTFFTTLADTVGELDRPLGDYEGAAIPMFVGIPVWPFYILVAAILTITGLLVYRKYPEPVVAAMIASSILFGWAHFEDWRYILFASFAAVGYGYAYYKTRNIVTSAMVHMGVDAIWALFLSY